jgi:Ca2+:H+ antiporter
VDVADSFVSQLVGLTAEILVGSINGLVSRGNISKEYVGIILLPTVGNGASTSVSLTDYRDLMCGSTALAEYSTIVTVSVKDKLDLCLGVAIGSSIVCVFQCRSQQPMLIVLGSKLRYLLFRKPFEVFWVHVSNF